jgi:hypothetical protein
MGGVWPASPYTINAATVQLCRTDCPASPPGSPKERRWSLIPDPWPLRHGATMQPCRTDRRGSGFQCISRYGEPRSRSSSATCRGDQRKSRQVARLVGRLVSSLISDNCSIWISCISTNLSHCLDKRWSNFSWICLISNSAFRLTW